MPKFEKGNKLGTGRPPGKLNRTTEMAKLTIARVANQGLNNISEDLEKIRKTNPVEAAKIYLKLLEYIVPKKQQIDLQANISQRIEQITVHVIQKDNDGIKHTNE
jgi:hypothetical protein